MFSLGHLGAPDYQMDDQGEVKVYDKSTDVNLHAAYITI